MALGFGTFAKQVSVGVQHTCSIVHRTAGGGARPILLCWGRAQHGQTGSGSTSSSGNLPSTVPALLNAVDLAPQAGASPSFPVQVSCSYDHTCVVLSKGELMCFGRNDYGQLGYASTDDLSESQTPAQRGGGGAAQVALPSPVAHVSAGRWHTCALLVLDGAVHCWGRNSDGQSGAGTGPGLVLTPTAVAFSGDEPVVALAAYALHSCAILASGGVSCWGNGGSGRLGRGSTDSVGEFDTPAAHPVVDLGEAAVHIALGTEHSCAVLVSGGVLCWGLATSGRLGPGVETNVGDLPSRLPSALGPILTLPFAAVAIVAGSRSTCAVSGTGLMRCWGSSSGIAEFPTAPFDPFVPGLRFRPSRNHTTATPVAVNVPFSSRYGSQGSAFQRTFLYTHGLSSRDILRTHLIGPLADFELAWVRTQFAVAGLPPAAGANYSALLAPQVTFALEALSDLSGLQAVPRWLGFAALAGVRREGIPQLPAALYATCARGGFDATEAEVPLSGIGYAACLWPDEWPTSPAHVLSVNGSATQAQSELGIASSGGLITFSGQFWPLVLLAPQGVAVTGISIAGQACTGVRIISVRQISCIAPALSAQIGNVSIGATVAIYHTFEPEFVSPLTAAGGAVYQPPAMQSASAPGGTANVHAVTTIAIKGTNLGPFTSKAAAAAAGVAASASVVQVCLLAAPSLDAALVGNCTVLQAWNTGIECSMPPMNTLRQVFLAVIVAGRTSIGPSTGVSVQYSLPQLQRVQPAAVLLHQGASHFKNTSVVGQALSSTAILPFMVLALGSDLCVGISAAADGRITCQSAPLDHTLLQLDSPAALSGAVTLDISLVECFPAVFAALGAQLGLQASPACAAAAAANPAVSTLQVSSAILPRGITVYSPIGALSIPPVQLPRSGGIISLSGSGFGRPGGCAAAAAALVANASAPQPAAGLATGDISYVLLHPMALQCTGIISNGFRISCVVPPGFRPVASVSVHRIDGSSSIVPATISYIPPIVSGCTPSSFIHAPAGVAFDVTCVGTDLSIANASSPLATGSIAGAHCASLTVLSSEEIICAGVQPYFMNATLQATGIRFTVAGVPVQTAPGALLRVGSRPALSGVRPALISAAGGISITLIGSGFGLGRLQDVVNATVGSAGCRVTAVSESAVTCDAPSAAIAAQMAFNGEIMSAPVAVSLLFAGGARAQLPDALTYAVPEIIAVQGGTMQANLGTAARANISASGLVLADGVGSSRMYIAGMGCEQLDGKLSTQQAGRKATCTKLLLARLPSPQPGEVDLHQLLVVTASGLNASSGVGSVRVVGPPLLERVAPSRARSNASVTLSGLLLGNSQGQIAAVHIGGQLSPAWRWLSDGVVVATVPDLAAALTATALGSLLSVELALTTGHSTRLQTAFSFESTPRPPLVAPRHVCSYRGADSSARVRFEWSRDSHTTGSQETAFLVEVFNASSALAVQMGSSNAGVSPLATQRRVDLQGAAVGGAVQAQAQVARDVTAPCVIPQAVRTPGSVIWDLQLPDIGLQPVWLRVRGGVQADSGALLVGPPSKVSNALLAKCNDDELLATQFAAVGAWDQVRCTPCPVGAVCRGAPWEAMGTLGGWARVPWSSFGLEHHKCAVPEACPGRVPGVFALGSLVYLRRLPIVPAPLTANSDLTGAHPPAAFHTYAVRTDLRALAANSTGGGPSPASLPGAVQVSAAGGLQAASGGGGSTSTGPGNTGADEQWQQECKEGHTGQLCSKCALGFGRVGTGLCAACNGTTRSAGLFVALFLALILALLWVLRGQLRSTRAHKKDHSVIKKVFLNHLQQVALLLSFNLDWPNPLKLTLQVSNSASSAAGDVASPDCLRSAEIPNSISSAFRIRVAATMAAAPLFMVICLVAVTVFTMRTQPNAKFCSATYVRLWLMSLFLVCFLLYSPITRTALQLFSCREISGQQRLTEDLSVLCNTPANNAWRFGLGLPVLLLFTVGFPALLSAMLHRKRAQLEEESTRKLLGFFYLGYKLEFYWYEVCVLLRKSAFALILVALSTAGTLWQASCGICVLVLSLLVTSWMRPFKKHIFNVLDCCSMCLSILTLAGGVVLVQFDPLLGLQGGDNGEASGGLAAQRAVTIVLTITNVFFVAVLVAWWAREWYTSEAASKVEHGLHLARRAGSALKAEAHRAQTSMRRIGSMSPRSARAASNSFTSTDNPLRPTHRDRAPDETGGAVLPAPALNAPANADSMPAQADKAVTKA